MQQVCTAQAWALCHECELRHPCFSFQNYLDFQERHQGHHVSYLDRDWAHEIARAPIAAWNPRHLIKSAVGAAGAWLLRRADGSARWVEYAPNADVKEAQQASQNFTLTLASLASSATAGREGTAVDNSSNLYLDFFVQFGFKLQTGTPANDKAIYVFAYGSQDGTNYTDNATGSDAAITMRDPTNLRRIDTVACPDSGGLTYKSNPTSVALAFGGWMPRKWGPAIRNYTGVTFSATEGDHSYRYNGVYATVI